MSTGVVEVVPAAPVESRRSRRKLWISIVAVLVVFGGGLIAAASMRSRYAHTAPLKCACGLAWASGEHERNVPAGPFSAMIARARPGQVQSFYVMIMNPAPVTQTILGLQYPGGETAEPEQLAVARAGTSTRDDQQDYASRRFTTRATAIPPHGIRWVRISIHTAPAAIWGSGRQEYWKGLYLRVRVGWFNRNETVQLENTAFVLESP